MNKKILSLCIGAVGIIVLATITSAVGLQSTETEKKESPLYKIRTDKAIFEKIDNIKSRFI